MMHKPFDVPGSRTDFYIGEPVDTYFSLKPELRPTYASTEHLIKAGHLIQIFGDTEDTDKDKETAKPWEVGFLALDLMGRQLGRLGFRMAVPDHVATSIGAGLVGGFRPQDQKEGWAGHIGAAMYVDFMRGLSHLDPRSLKLTPQIFDDKTSGYLYPLTFPDHDPVLLELQKAGKKFRPQGERSWDKVYAATHFFNGEQYDIPVFSHELARYNAPALFPFTRRSHSAVHVDVRGLMKWLWAFGDQGKTGIQYEQRWHREFGCWVVNTRQGDLAHVNSPTANRQRGIMDGVFLPNGQEHDREKDHGAMQDALTAAGLYFYARRTQPEAVAFVESMTHEKLQKEYLQGNKGFGDRPLVGFIYSYRGMLKRGIGMMVDTGDKYGQLKKNEVLLFNLSDHDPETVSRLNNNHLRAGITDGPNPFVIPLRVNRTCTFAPFEQAYEAGTGRHLTPEEYKRRQMWLVNHQDFVHRLMSVRLDQTSERPTSGIITSRKLEDDSYSHYGDLKRIRYKDQTTGQWIEEPMDVYERFKQKWNRARDFDTVLRRIMHGDGLKPHAVEYSDAPEALTDYLINFEKSKKDLARAQENWASKLELPALPPPTTTVEARQHLWEMRAFLGDKVIDFLPERYIKNERGQILPWEKIIAMPYSERRDLWPKHEDFAEGPHLKLVFQRNENLSLIRNTLMAYEANDFYQKHGDPEFRAWWKDFFRKNYGPSQKWYEAYVTVNAIQGPPNLEPNEHPTMTVARRKVEINRMIHEAPGHPDGDYIRQALNTPQGQRNLAEWKKATEESLAAHPPSLSKIVTMGYDPETHYPSHNTRFWVPRQGKNVIRLHVPEVMIDNPSWNNQWGRHHVLATPDDATIELLKQLPSSWDVLPHQMPQVVLVSEETGRQRLAARAVPFNVPKTSEGSEALRQATSLYATIDKALGRHPLILSFEDTYPIHGGRFVDESYQLAKLPPETWAGLVDTRAGGLPKPMKPLTGLLVRDLDLGREFEPGPIRLRRTEAGLETGDEFQANLAKAQRIKVADLKEMSDLDARRFGSFSAADLYSTWRKVFANLSLRQSDQSLWRDADQGELWMLELEKPVNKKSYTYLRPEELQVARYTPQRPSDNVPHLTSHPQRQAA